MNRAAGMGLHVDGSAVQHTKFDVKCFDHIQTVSVRPSLYRYVQFCIGIDAVAVISIICKFFLFANFA